MSKLGKKSRVSVTAIVVAAIIVSGFSVLASVVLRAQPASGLSLEWATYVGSGTYVGAGAAHLIPGSNGMQIVVTGVSKVDQGYTNGSIIVLNGTSGSIIWEVNASGIRDHSPFEIADLNSDGDKQIVVADSRMTLALHGNNGSVYWNSSVPSNVNWPVIGDVNGDGYPEVFVCSGLAPYEGIDYISELSHDGQLLAQTPDWHSSWGGLSLADPAFNGTFILYQGDRSSTYSAPGDNYTGGGWGVRALDALTLAPLWNDSQILCSSHIPMLVDVDDDGILDVVVGWQGSGLAVYNALNGSVLTTGDIYRRNSTLGLVVHSQPTIYVDTNGHPQIITNLNSTPTIWDLRTWQETATLPYIAGDPPKMGRVTSDNQSDIILVESSNVHVFNQSFQEVANFTGLANPNAFTLVQDVDGDGYNELVLTSRSGWVYALGTPAQASTQLPRSDISFYSEYRLGVADYVEPPGPKTPLVSSPNPANGTTGVPINQTTLSFNLTDYQDYRMNYTVTTDPSIGGGNGTSVGNGQYSISVSGLQYLTTYSWTVAVTDGRVPNVTNCTFTTGGPEEVDVEVVSIAPVVYYSGVYVYEGQMRVGSGNASAAMLIYSIHLRRLDNNTNVPDLVVDVTLNRVNVTDSPADAFAHVNSTRIVLTAEPPGNEYDVTLTWYEDDSTSNLSASPEGVTWMIGCLANVTSPDVNNTDLSNDILWNGNVTAYTGLVSDFNGDGAVDIRDAVLLSDCYGMFENDSAWNPDVNVSLIPDPASEMQVIDLFDAVVVSTNFGKHMP